VKRTPPAIPWLTCLAACLTLSAYAQQTQKPAPRPPATAKPAPATAKPAAPQFFTTPLTIEQMKGKQAVLETDLGTIIVDLLPEAAPNHVGYFIKNEQAGPYNWHS